MNSIIHLSKKIFEIGILPTQHEALQRKIKICNQIAFSLAANSIFFIFVLLFTQQSLLLWITIPILCLYVFAIFLNYLHFHTLSRLFMAFFPAISVALINALYTENGNVVVSLYILSFILVMLPWLLFDVEDKWILLSLSIFNGGITFLTIPLSNLFAIHLDPAIFSSSTIGTFMPIAILAITISFLYILKHDADSAEQKKLRSLIDKLHIQQMEFLTQNEELTQQRIELGEKQAEISEQNEELLQQKEELRSVNDALQDTFQQLQTTTQRLSKSINYAQNIQRVVLPTPEDLGLFFSENWFY